jgi:hypothetical protein
LQQAHGSERVPSLKQRSIAPPQDGQRSVFNQQGNLPLETDPQTPRPDGDELIGSLSMLPPNISQNAHGGDAVKQPSGSQNKIERSPQITGPAPVIRLARVSSDVALSPAPGADKYWTYLENANAYYHVDSDTGSTIWREEQSHR